VIGIGGCRFDCKRDALPAYLYSADKVVLISGDTVKMLVTDPSIRADGFFGEADPTEHGGVIEFLPVPGDYFRFTLAKANWKRLGRPDSPKGYTYRGPNCTIRLRHQQSLRVKCRAQGGFSPSETPTIPERWLGVKLRTGEQPYCVACSALEFGPTRNVYRATGCPRPDSCLAAP
jgi:hypothetical protein